MLVIIFKYEAEMTNPKTLPARNQPEDRMEYEKPELEEIELLDETAKGFSEPPPPDSGY